MKDRVAHGCSNRGARNGTAVLKEQEVIEILKSTSLKNVELAKIYGVSRQLIYDIKTKRKWRWIDIDSKT